MTATATRAADAPTVADHLRYWDALVTTALLGTDRRDPPSAPAGALADLEADLPTPTPSARLLQQAAGLAAARRAGVLPAPPAAPLAAAPADPRPCTPPAATATWQRIVTEWQVLEDEWLLTVVQHGWRVAPELVVPLLARHRGDAVRHARALLAVGPLGEWMVGLASRLATTSRTRPATEAVASLPELPVVPELAALLHAAPAAVAQRLTDGLARGEFGAAHRAVLTNFLARVDAAVLPTVADALDRMERRDDRAPLGLAFSLAHLARLRHHALGELPPVVQEAT